MRREAAFGVFCLTTVYPTDTLGVHGNSGGKSAGKDVFSSGKGRKCLEISGNRYSGFLWEQDAAGSSPVIPTKRARYRRRALLILLPYHNRHRKLTLSFLRDTIQKKQ